jgi:hypothetical protein
MTTVYIVMSGNYEPVVDSVFSDGVAANRRAAALREGYSYSIEIDKLVADDYCYKVDYDSTDDWLNTTLVDDDNVGGVKCDDDGWCITFVRAKSHSEAGKLGRAKIFGYLGKEEVIA